jgi:hypothetical protein
VLLENYLLSENIDLDILLHDTHLVKRAVPAPDPSEAPRPGHGIPHMERAHPNLSNNAGFLIQTD